MDNIIFEQTGDVNIGSGETVFIFKQIQPDDTIENTSFKYLDIKIVSEVISRSECEYEIEMGRLDKEAYDPDAEYVREYTSQVDPNDPHQSWVDNEDLNKFCDADYPIKKLETSEIYIVNNKELKFNYSLSDICFYTSDYVNYYGSDNFDPYYTVEKLSRVEKWAKEAQQAKMAE